MRKRTQGAGWETCELTFSFRFNKTAGRKYKNTSTFRCATYKDNEQMQIIRNTDTQKHRMSTI